MLTCFVLFSSTRISMLCNSLQLQTFQFPHLSLRLHLLLKMRMMRSSELSSSLLDDEADDSSSLSSSDDFSSGKVMKTNIVNCHEIRENKIDPFNFLYIPLQKNKLTNVIVNYHHFQPCQNHFHHSRHLNICGHVVFVDFRCSSVSLSCQVRPLIRILRLK